MAGRNDPSWPPSYIPRLGTLRALRTYQWSETPMARWARRGVGASIRARPGHGHAPMPTRRSIAIGTKKGARQRPFSERTRAPPDRQNLWRRSPPAGSRVPAPATATAGGVHCMRERRRRSREPSQRDKPGQRRVHAQGPVLEARRGRLARRVLVLAELTAKVSPWRRRRNYETSRGGADSTEENVGAYVGLVG